MFKALGIIPLHVISLAIYASLAFTGTDMTATSFTYGLPSGAVLVVSTGDWMVMLALLLLFIEIVKAVQIGWTSTMNNLFSSILFLCAFGFLLTNSLFGTTSFFLLTAIMFSDAFIGFIVGWASARRDWSFGG